MDEVVKIAGPGGPAIVIGGALGWLLNWFRQSRREARRDAYAQITEATQKLIDAQNDTIGKQSERISQLDGRIEQLTAQMRLDLLDTVQTRADLAAANATISRLNTEVADWQRRWDEHFPTTSKETL